MIILNQTFIILLILIFYVLLSIKQMELLNLVELPSEVNENRSQLHTTILHWRRNNIKTSSL